MLDLQKIIKDKYESEDCTANLQLLTNYAMDSIEKNHCPLLGSILMILKARRVVEMYSETYFHIGDSRQFINAVLDFSEKDETFNYHQKLAKSFIDLLKIVTEHNSQ